MRLAVKCRRGMTLAELMVTLGLVVVMIAMAVSFVMMMSGQTKASGDNLVFQQDFSAVNAVVEGWMTSVAGQTLTVEGSAVTAGDKSLQFQNGVLFVTDGVDLRTASIGAVTFQLEGWPGKYLLFCTVQRAESTESYTFCVYPRVGETVGA